MKTFVHRTKNGTLKATYSQKFFTRLCTEIEGNWKTTIDGYNVFTIDKDMCYTLNYDDYEIKIYLWKGDRLYHDIKI